MTRLTKVERERRIFESFLEFEPLFASEAIVSWQQPDDDKDFPDINATTISGRRIGVELAEWLHFDELVAAKQKEQAEAQLLHIVDDLPHTYTHIGTLWLHRRADARAIKPADKEAFRSELLTYLRDCDTRWPTERYWHTPHGARLRGEEFEKFGTLSRFLAGISAHPRGNFVQGQPWILFPARVNAFDEKTMFNPLIDRVSEKIDHYTTGSTGFEHLTLLVHYSSAVLYNSPPETPWFTFDDAAEELRELLAGQTGVFDQVLLYVAVEPGKRVIALARRYDG